MSTNHLLFCLPSFSPTLNPFSFHVLGWARACPACLFSLTLVGEACLSGQLSVRGGARHYTQKFAIAEIWFFPLPLLSVVPTESLGNIPAVPVTQCPPVTMPRWGTLTHMVLHTSSQVRFLTEMPRVKLRHLCSQQAGSHKLRAHTPCFSSKDQQQPHHRAAHKSQLPEARQVQTRFLQNRRELHTGLLLFLPTTDYNSPSSEEETIPLRDLGFYCNAYLHVLLCN